MDILLAERYKRKEGVMLDPRWYLRERPEDLWLFPRNGYKAIGKTRGYIPPTRSRNDDTFHKDPKDKDLSGRMNDDTVSQPKG